ncbi:IGF-like family receptor 1 [Cynoglossus semilaevis]|uniref:IGF-like family receptor 1 n=1 Tax=Cynoglossus semilaevis TaxID=244447 RepID=A0A3P8VAV8_CYNSE|nr:IGF-like family receptor 1 [Cynoglossus semilaevis]
MGHSLKCSNLTTRWDRHMKKCVPCEKKPGTEITPNCGYDDQGGIHELQHKNCTQNCTFNDGSQAYCQPCTSCPPEFTVHVCNLTSDTLCQAPRTQSMTSAPVTTHAVQTATSTTPKPTNHSTHHNIWLVPLVILLIVFILCIAIAIYKKKIKGRSTMLSSRRKSSKLREGPIPLFASSADNDLEALLKPEIHLAPLQTLLDHLDVLEQLVVLLDPDSPGVKNTKHLASYCSFPSTWITYTYSMKDTKSPLKAVLEGVTSRNPDWTVGHLARLLKQMERNDAIAVLSQLRPNEMAV